MLASIRTILFRYIYDRNLSSSPSCLGLGVTNWLTVTKYTLHKRQWIFSVLRRFSRSSITQRLLSNWQWLCLSSICALSQILSGSVLSIPDFPLCFFQHFSFLSSFGCLCKVFQTRCPTFTIWIHVYDVLKLLKRFIVVLDCQMIYF